MATTGILKAENVVFYHPLDDFDESAVGQTWTGTAAFASGKVPGAGPIGLSSVTGSAFSFGADSSVSAQNWHPSIMGIDSARALVYYRSAANESSCRVATVSGTAVTLGTGIVVGLGTTGAYPIAKLSSSKFVLVRRNTALGISYSSVVTVSGTDCTTGASATHAAHILKGDDGGSVVTLDSTHVVVAWAVYDKNAAIGIRLTARARVGTVSGTDITYGVENTVATSGTANSQIPVLQAAALSSTKVVAIWERDAGSGNELGSVTMTVSGNDITGGTPKQAESSNPHSFGICAIDSTRFAVSFRPNYTIRVGTVSGTDITYGSAVGLDVSGSTLTNVPRCFKLDTNKVIVSSRIGNSLSAAVEVFSISGTTPSSLGRSTFDPTPGAQSEVLAGVLSASKIVVGTYNTTNNAFIKAGELGLSADLTAPTPAAYPSTIGDTRVVMAFWAVNPTVGSTSLDIERGYKATLTATTISLGGTTAVWSAAAIGTLMTSLNDGLDHLLVLDFENTSGTTWTLKTSVDGAAFTSQGSQTSGTQAVTTADTAPQIAVTDASGGTQWFDEMVVWSGDKATFESFTTQELANLNDLADTFGEPMNQFEENFGAPLCWQATATMPDGTVWRDSGSGPCPPVVRIPRGADDIVVTDDDRRVSPKIIEG